MVSKLETDFVHDTLKPELQRRFPGCVIIKQDPSASFQGMLDHVVLYEDKWAVLEAKRKPKAARQPSQEYYVDKFNGMSFSAFIDPDNMDEVLDDLQSAFRPEG